MSSLRRRLWSAIAISIGVLLVLGGLTAPAIAVTSRTIGLAAKPTAAVAGSKVTLYGYLSKSPTGSTVKLQRKSGSSWVTSTSTKTKTSSGYYSFSVTASSTPGTYYYRTVASATSKLGSATSKTVSVTALRKVTASIKVSPSTITAPRKITVSGAVKPFVSGDYAFVQRFNGAKWIDLTTALISKTGTYSRTFTAEATTTYRVYVPRHGFNSSATSASAKVTFDTGPQPPVITTTSLPDGFTDTVYSQTLTKTGDAGTWAVTSGALPPGLTLGQSSGTITGTPTAGGTFNFTVTFSQNGNLLFDRQALSIKVLVKPRITTTALPRATAYSNYTTTLSKTGQPGTWSITSGSLPAGITFDTGTGTLAGKPTVAGSYPLTFKYAETTSGLFVTKSLPLTVDPAPDPVITTASLPNATAFSNYSTQLVRTGNAGTWSIMSGTLPNGLSLDSATGTISGKPTVSGDFPLTFKFTETESGTFDTKSLPLHVNPAPDPVITTTSLPAVLINANYSQSLSRTGNAGTWSISAGALPAGLTLDPDTGLISGAPTVSGTFGFTVKFTETESGTFDTQALSILVYSRPTITTTGLPDALKDNAYSATLTKSGGSGSGTWSVTSGALPTGLSLSSGGVISGTATVNGDYTFTVRFADSVTGAATNKALTIHVGPTAIKTGSLPDGKVGTAYSVQLDAAPSGISGWSLDSGTLPPGLSLSSGGVISGTPTTAGDYTFAVTYSVLLKPSRTRTFTLHVSP